MSSRRRRVDLLHGEIDVAEQLHELRGGQVVAGPPKTAAGERTVAIPERDHAIAQALDDMIEATHGVDQEHRGA